MNAFGAACRGKTDRKRRKSAKRECESSKAEGSEQEKERCAVEDERTGGRGRGKGYIERRLAGRKQGKEIQVFPQEKTCEKKNGAARDKTAGEQVGKRKRSKGKIK
ncbi:hypothetical protein [Stomatobaculum longum]|uniref:hypothetical protein n=1 Tax=Stomatobaculum longum TaxID=796942 RepID=UPI0028ECE540|nr:hypothetical protein [Stomatobaculum longum]